MITEKNSNDETIRIDTIHMLDKLNNYQLETVQAIIRDIIARADDYLSIDSEDNSDIVDRRKKIFGSLKGKIRIADDFNDTPDCFKEYVWDIC